MGAKKSSKIQFCTKSPVGPHPNHPFKSKCYPINILILIVIKGFRDKTVVLIFWQKNI